MTATESRILLATFKEPASQQAVDVAQAMIRADLASGRRSLFKQPPSRPDRSNNVLEQRIAEELYLVIRQLGQVGDILSDDPILIHRHAAQMQSIDRMQQVLGILGKVVGSADKAMEVEGITLPELRERLARKPLRPLVD